MTTQTTAKAIQTTAKAIQTTAKTIQTTAKAITVASTASHTTATTTSIATTHRGAALSAMLLGSALLFLVGFAPMPAVHNAAHDTRHSAAFPCH